MYKLIGRGTSRIAYLVGDEVIKTFDHELGYEQSMVEKYIYENVPEKFKKHFNPILFVCEDYQVSKYCKEYKDYNLHMWDHPSQFFTMNWYEEGPIPYINESEELVDWLDSIDVHLGDLLASTNYGVTENNDICFIDYGMTREMIPKLGEAIEAGVLPCITERQCDSCDRYDEMHVYLGNRPYLCDVCGGKELNDIRDRTFNLDILRK